jgi:hypothetical protein
VNGYLSCDGQTITDAFSKYFALAVQSNYQNYAIPNCEDFKNCLLKVFTQSFPAINLKWVSPKEIQDITKSLRTENSYRYDGISTKILRSSIPYISSPLTHIRVCNRMLITGYFPTRLKFLEIRPIFKRGDKNGSSNYRPISLLTSLSKILKKYSVTDYTIILRIIIFCPTNSLVLGMHCRLKMPLIT